MMNNDRTTARPSTRRAATRASASAPASGSAAAAPTKKPRAPRRVEQGDTAPSLQPKALASFETADVSAFIRKDFVRFKAELCRIAPYGAERFRELVPLRTVPLV